MYDINWQALTGVLAHQVIEDWMASVEWRELAEIQDLEVKMVYLVEEDRQVGQVWNYSESLYVDVCYI